jgi:TfoX/Sxy family transcriptional regulator of competence genes
MPMNLPPRASAEALQRFQSAIDAWPEVATRQMFGFPCAFANGQMFLHLFGDELVLRLADDDRAAFIAATGAAPFTPSPGRGMREYVVVPAAVARSAAELEPWVAKALAHVRTLPPKEPKARKRKAAR